MERKDLLEKLKVKIPYQWRVQSFSKNKPEATCVAYIDARDVMNLLDTTCSEGWQNDYKEIKGNLFCGIAIKLNGEWEWRWDCGTESNTEKEKGEASDSFKRAAVKWGIGRFLYDLEIVRVAANEKKGSANYPHVIDAAGKQVWDITKFINDGKHKDKPKTESKALESARPITDQRPVMTEKMFNQTIERISSGEIDLLDKVMQAMIIKPDYLARLESEHNMFLTENDPQK